LKTSSYSNLETVFNKTNIFNLSDLITESNAPWMRIKFVWFAVKRLLRMKVIVRTTEAYAVSAAEHSFEGQIKEQKRSTNAKLVSKILCYKLVC
jgi:hypothetical protein